MQNKGALKLLIFALLIASAYTLSFTLVSRSVERKADRYAATFNIDQQAEKRQNFLDSMRTQTVYNLGFVKFTYKQVKEKELNLGLDLKGGMNVLLEISPKDIVRSLANNNDDPLFVKALDEAQVEYKSGSGTFVDYFVGAYDRLSGGSRLVDIFSTPDVVASKQLTSSSTNADVAAYLQKQVNDAIDNSFLILSKRIDKFGIAQPNIQRVKNSGRILIELPGISEPERVRKLLQGTASLEFWMTYDNAKILPVLDQVNTALRNAAALEATQVTTETTETTEAAVAATAAADTTTVGGVGALEQLGTAQTTVPQNVSESNAQNPLFSRLQANVTPDGMPIPQTPIVGHAASYDTMAINQYLRSDLVRSMLPHDLKLMWSVNPNPETHMFELYAIRDRSGKGIADLDGGAVESATGDYGQYGSEGEVNMTMNNEGRAAWERITRDALNENNLAAGFTKSVAIVLDNYVYSAPGVINVITGGSSRITGNFSIEEAKDLANVLRSGKLPAPARIVQDTVVGPSLGQESINASLLSFVLAFALVLIYMMLFYSTAGWVASIALVCNLFLLLGILVSFGAVLTLPGIAGIVLTMGMAVDANVIIYERVKEELRAGKGLSAAVQAGYKHAMSAIIDSNATTLLTAIILMWFGTGPVQGFATTLFIGVITSFFTSVFVSRLIFDSRLQKGRNIKFSTKFTENFLANTHIDFLGKRKIFYALSLFMVLIGIVSLSTRGLNYGVDFTGGRAYVIRFDQAVTRDQVFDAVDRVFAETVGDATDRNVEVKQFGNENQMRIVTQYRSKDEGPEVTSEIEGLLHKALNPLFAQPLTELEFETTSTNSFGIISSDNVEASVASELVINAFWAVALGLVGIGLYIVIRFRRWQWGAGSVVGLAHDAFLTLGLFSLLYSIMPFSLEIDQSFIAALLTVIGFSINDKVVIFDRIREYQGLYPKRSMRDNINNALNSTLSRTINTSGTAFVTMLGIFVFGGEVIRGFVFAIMFGIIMGTYSSIFTATPLAYDMLNRHHRDKTQK